MISDITYSSVHVASGSAQTFATGITALTAADVTVLTRNAASVPKVQIRSPESYTVSGLKSPGGVSVELNPVATAGTEVIVYRSSVFLQFLDGIRNVTLDGPAVEDQLDRIVLSLQELDKRMNTCVRVPSYEEGSMLLPGVLDRNEVSVIGFNLNGELTLFPLDVDGIEIVSPDTVGTPQIQNGAVTSQKLAMVLDLTGKTITLPAGSVSAANLASVLDLSSKTVNLPNASVEGKHIRLRSIGGDHIGNKTLSLRQLFIGPNQPPAVEVTGSTTSGVNGTYTKNGVVQSGRPEYQNTIGYKFRYNALNGTWALVVPSGFSNLYVSQGHTIGLVGARSPDGVRSWLKLVSPTPQDILEVNPSHTDAVLVDGTVRATKFIGDISECTGFPTGSTGGSGGSGGTVTSSILFVAEPAGYNSATTALVGSDGFVYVAGTPEGSFLFDPGSDPLASFIRVPFKPGAVAISGLTAGLNSGSDRVVQLVAGPTNLLALTNLGFVYSMGANNTGQLGQGSSDTALIVPYFQSIRFDVSGTNKRIKKIFMRDTFGAGFGTSCFAIDEDDKVWSWGRNSNGELGVGSALAVTSPVRLPSLASLAISKVVSNSRNTWFLTSQGEVFACGANLYGELATGNTLGPVVTPQLIATTGITKIITDIASGGRIFPDTNNGGFFMALDSTGKVYTCGRGIFGEIGNGASLSVSTLTQVSLGFNASKIWADGLASGGVAFAQAQASGFQVSAWGYSGNGALGVSPAAIASGKTNSPSGVQGLPSGLSISKLIHLSTGGLAEGTSIALLSDGSVYGAGSGNKGQLGNGSVTQVGSFERIQLPLCADIFQASAYTWVAKSTTGQFYAIGDNEWYQKGLGHNKKSYSPSVLKL